MGQNEVKSSDNSELQQILDSYDLIMKNSYLPGEPLYLRISSNAKIKNNRFQ